MGQLYNNLPWVALDSGYTNEEFAAELGRLNAAQFSPGDRIRVTGYYLSYNVKLNVNEQHNKNPDHDFTIELVQRGVGLPRPELVTLDDLKNDSDAFIFDPTRQSGGEYYQARLIKIEGVYFADANDWRPYGEVVITDGVKTLAVKLGRGNGIYTGSNNLTEPFDIIGILDQESPNLTDGYPPIELLFAMRCLLQIAEFSKSTLRHMFLGQPVTGRDLHFVIVTLFLTRETPMLRTALTHAAYRNKVD